ncbi:uracil-DNA glycosylase [uncultured Shimia sp.]|uniref:uracil-DNA glycosylase n=1 Tax=uncultured Shimia sp. TaxID=573152 RepID=UPI00344A3211
MSAPLAVYSAAMESALDYHTARALLEWHVELGATEAILDAPLDRYEVPKEDPKKKAAAAALPETPAAPVRRPKIDPVAEAEKAAKAAGDLAALEQAMAQFEHCTLKRGARNLVFADGNPAARMMIIGDAPDRDEDREGKPFVSRAGALFDNMFSALEMGRDVPMSKDALYIAPVVPWRAQRGGEVPAPVLKMMRPFLERHIQLVAPDVIVLMGNAALECVSGQRGISRARGQWQTAFDKPVLPMMNPADLLRRPALKREAWADLLSLKAKLDETS